MGDRGEALASEYLKNKGYRFIGQKVKLFCGEIDLLFQDGQNLVIVEVKTKSDTSYGQAAEMVNFRKKRKLLQLAKALWQKFPRRTIRIDVVAIDQLDQIEHIKSAVEEGWRK